METKRTLKDKKTVALKDLTTKKLSKQTETAVKGGRALNYPALRYPSISS